jgi:hypothetical protein
MSGPAPAPRPRARGAPRRARALADGARREPRLPARRTAASSRFCAAQVCMAEHSRPRMRAVAASCSKHRHGPASREQHSDAMRVGNGICRRSRGLQPGGPQPHGKRGSSAPRGPPVSGRSSGRLHLPRGHVCRCEAPEHQSQGPWRLACTIVPPDCESATPACEGPTTLTAVEYSHGCPYASRPAPSGLQHTMRRLLRLTSMPQGSAGSIPT